MNDDEISDEEERRLLEMFQGVALNDFPNPNRIGCPGADFLRKLASDRNSILVRDPRVAHVARCSPCYRELAAFRKRTAKRTLVRLILVAALFVACVSAAGIWQFSQLHRLSSKSGENYVAATLDLKDRAVVRGGNGSLPPKINSLRLAKERLSLTITLPFASETGIYEVQILRELGRPILAASGEARLENGATVLVVRLDLSEIRSGRYLVGIHRVPLDWTFHPVVIE